jgi:hypothetical protein
MRTPHIVFQNRRTSKKTLTLIALLISVTLVATNVATSKVTATTTSAQFQVVLEPTDAPLLEGTSQQIGKQEGGQWDPRTDGGNIVSYTDYTQNGLQSRIRYFNLATNTDHLIPGDVSSASNVNGGRIAFHNVVGPGAFESVVFDTVSQTRIVTLPGVGLPAIGGNLMAVVKPLQNERDYELETYDLNTGVTTRLTDDHYWDSWQDVSPSGNAVVWTKCDLNGFSCDIFSAIQTSPGVFTSRKLTGPESEDHIPDTNGQIAAYLKRQNEEWEPDIYFQPVEGGEETRLQIPYSQQLVKVAGNLIAFSSSILVSQNTAQIDIFVYDISTGVLSRVTNTPGHHEWLGDFNISNGVGRIVYSKSDTDFSPPDIYAFTFAVPNSAEEQIEDLTDLIEGLNLPVGTASSLITKLQNALTAIDAGDTATACDSLTAFINATRAQSGKKLTAAQAADLITAAEEIKLALGCP